MDREELAFLRAKLESMLELRLNKSRAAMETMSQAAMAPADAVDRAAMETQRHLELLMRERDLAEIREIREALSRILVGEYGACRECGEDIDVRRLRARPMVDLCVSCMTGREREQNRGREVAEDLIASFGREISGRVLETA
jgi:DnaK suppressor protein